MINRKYKDTLFKKLFEQKENALELYNALTGCNYTDPDLVEINTIDSIIIYIGVHNDVSLLIENNLQLWEHQSTYNPKMPDESILKLSDAFDTLKPDIEVLPAC